MSIYGKFNAVYKTLVTILHYLNHFLVKREETSHLTACMTQISTGIIRFPVA